MENLYRCFSVGVKKRNLIPYDENYLNKVFSLINKDPNCDYYESIYLYNEENFQSFNKTKSLSGIEGIKTDRIVFDFDDKNNTKNAFNDANILVKRLLDSNIKENAIRIAYSGNKGVHIEIYLNEKLDRKQFEAIVENFAGDLNSFDHKIKDEQRLFRFPLTKHNNTKRYKIPLSIKQLQSYDLNKIEQLSMTDENEEFLNLLNAYQTIDLPESFKSLTVINKSEIKSDTPVEVTDKPDMSRKPSHLTSAKYVLQEGFFEEGERNEACMILASTYRYLGYNKELAYNMIKATLRLRAERLGRPEYDKRELWNTIIKVVYSPLWKGGLYSEEEGLLKKTIERYSLEKTIESQATNLVSLSNVSSVYRDFAVNIDKNTIKLGIPEIDQKVRVTTSMLVCLLAAPGAGKCLGKDTLIRMYDGSLKKVQDINIGDLLMGDDSTPRKVLSTTNGIEELYKIHQTNGNAYVVNKSHILSLKCVADFNDQNKAKKYIKNDIVDIELIDYLNKDKYWKKYYKGYKVGVEYKNKNVNLDPYILGMWLGDGTSSKPEITNTDYEVINFMDNYFLDKNLTRKTYDNITHSYTKSTSKFGKKENWFISELKQLEVLNNKHIPKLYLHNSKEIRKKLLAGLIDSDGYINGTRGEITFKNEILAKNTLELIRSLGLKATFSNKNIKYNCLTKGKTYKGNGLYYRIYFSGEELSNIPTKIKRKQVKEFKTNTSVLSTSIKLEPLGKGEYYGFEIDGNKRFLLEDFTVTHNTSVSLGILNTMSKNQQKALFFSLDMAIPQVYQRLIQKHTGDHPNTIEKNYVTNNLNKIEEYENVLNNEYEHVKFCFRTGLTTEEMRNVIIKERDKTGVTPKLIVIDYLECVKGPFSDSNANKALIATQLKDIANEFGICVFLLTQPTKMDGDPSYELSSYTQIKGSSVIGEAASVVFTMYRPGFSSSEPQYDKYAVIKVVKNRMGELSTTELGWEGLTGRIFSLDSEQRMELKELQERIKQSRMDSKKNDGNLW